MNPQQTKQFFATIPHTQILTSWLSVGDLIEKLLQLSPQKIDVGLISTPQAINQVSALVELLLQINEQLPSNCFFDAVNLPNQKLAVVFLDETQEMQLIYREGLGNAFPILYSRNERAYKAEFDELVKKYKVHIQDAAYQQAVFSISEAYHLIAEMNMDFGVDFEKFDRKQLCLDWVFCYEQLGKYEQAAEMRKIAEVHRTFKA